MGVLGVYWSVMHRRPQDYDYFKALQPSVFKIMDGGAPDYQWAEDNLRNCVILARDWALSEQHSDMMRDPVGTGKRHAQEWRRHADRLSFDLATTMVLGINEPRVWEPGVPEALRQYTIAMCDEAASLGMHVGAMQLSVGWPANNGPDTPPDWSPYHGVDEAIRRGNHALVAHEYWADQGPAENWGWWGGRVLRCPWQVPIVIGECGIDMYVKDASVPHAQRGWRGRKTEDGYAHELWQYTEKMSVDPRFVGCAVFASDFANREWFSFDIEPAYNAILAAAASYQGNNDKTDTYLPSVNNAKLPTPPAQPTPTGIIDPRVAQAILRIESGGRTHGDNGKPIIRFESHIFRKYLANDALWSQHFRADPQKPWTNQLWRPDGGVWQDLHTGSQASEYAAFEFAKSLNSDAAYNAISVGAPQIVGFNHAKIGYPSAQAMYESFQSAPMQTFAFTNFILSDPGLFDAVKRRDWREIAKRYNGAGNVDAYAPLLEKAYQELG